MSRGHRQLLWAVEKLLPLCVEAGDRQTNRRRVLGGLGFFRHAQFPTTGAGQDSPGRAEAAVGRAEDPGLAWGTRSLVPHSSLALPPSALLSSFLYARSFCCPVASTAPRSLPSCGLCSSVTSSYCVTCKIQDRGSALLDSNLGSLVF